MPEKARQELYALKAGVAVVWRRIKRRERDIISADIESEREGEI